VKKLDIIRKSPGLFIIDGDLTFSSIDRRTLKTASFITQGKDIVIDLSRVSSTDSAGLALMIEWLKLARINRSKVHFKNIPTQLMTLAKLSGFDKTAYFHGQAD
jgi:phospholipid transport system transporter-binding protein